MTQLELENKNKKFQEFFRKKRANQNLRKCVFFQKWWFGCRFCKFSWIFDFFENSREKNSKNMTKRWKYEINYNNSNFFETFLMIFSFRFLEPRWTKTLELWWICENPVMFGMRFVKFWTSFFFIYLVFLPKMRFFPKMVIWLQILKILMNFRFFRKFWKIISKWVFWN